MEMATVAKPKIMTIVGTRPEIIRLSRVIALLDESVDHLLVHTGQNSDKNLNEVFFNELSIRKPDFYLNVDTSSLGSSLGDVIKKIEPVLLETKPDGVLILGDTNSAIAAFMAKRMNITVYHMEAGNRSFDENVPEETNRKLVDHISDFNLAYTEHARRNLLSEGLHPRQTMVCGSPILEIFNHYQEKILSSSILDHLNLKPQEYFLVSAHRQENVDSKSRLIDLVETLRAIRDEWDLPVLVSTHPRTKKQLELQGLDKNIEGIIFHEPFGFFDYNKLQLNAKCVLSDSGTISEESMILGFPSVTIRDSMERPEALESAGVIMTGLKSDEVINGVRIVTSSHFSNESIPNEYLVSDCSKRVIWFLLSTLSRHKEWVGIRNPFDAS